MKGSDRAWRERGLRSAVLAGDAQAWKTWYEESYPGLAAYVAWRCAGLRDLVEEIVQETWLTAVRRIRSFDPDRGNFAGWLRGIAANLLRNHFRSRANRAAEAQLRNGQLVPDRTVEAAAQREEEAQRIAAALAALPERYEAALRAKYLDQQTVMQISEQWGETPKAIESLLSRARQGFREAWIKTR